MEPWVRNRTDFKVLDETDDYIVVDKPAPLLVHPSVPSTIPTLWNELRRLLVYELVNGATLSIINRLDRETSGVVLITKHAKAARSFSRLMQARQVRKGYQAIVWGWPEQESFSIDAPLLRKGERLDSPIWLKRMVHPEGQSARTDVHVQRRFERRTQNGKRFALLDLYPETGRMHQLRVHLQHAGYPIVGDKIYGPDERCYLEFIETGWTESLATRLLMDRHALHAVSLKFDGYPEWRAPLPLEWEAFLSPTETLIRG